MLASDANARAVEQLALLTTPEAKDATKAEVMNSFYGSVENAVSNAAEAGLFTKTLNVNVSIGALGIFHLTEQEIDDQLQAAVVLMQNDGFTVTVNSRNGFIANVTVSW
jgi:hypothetical protein